MKVSSLVFVCVHVVALTVQLGEWFILVKANVSLCTRLKKKIGRGFELMAFQLLVPQEGRFLHLKKEGGLS